jgi:hypothetical protein
MAESSRQGGGSNGCSGTSTGGGLCAAMQTRVCIVSAQHMGSLCKLVYVNDFQIRGAAGLCGNAYLCAAAEKVVRCEQFCQQRHASLALR